MQIRDAGRSQSHQEPSADAVARLYRDHSEVIQSVGYRAWRKFSFLPGNYLDVEDWRQVAAMELVRNAGKLQGMPSGFVATLLMRRCIDYGRAAMDIGREERKAVARGEPRPRFALLSMDAEPDNGALPLAGKLEDNSRSPLDWAEISRTRERFRRNDAGLTEREMLVVDMYYFDDLSMQEIGSRLGIVESRVSQIHAKAIRKQREYMSTMQEAMQTALKEKKRCAPCEEAGRFRFADTEREGIPMCTFCERDVRADGTSRGAAPAHANGHRTSRVRITNKKKLCVCGCGTEFTPTGNRQSYALGHAPAARKGAKEKPRGSRVAVQSAPVAPAVPTVEPSRPAPSSAAFIAVRMPVDALDRFWNALAPEDKARAIERILAEEEGVPR